MLNNKSCLKSSSEVIWTQDLLVNSSITYTHMPVHTLRYVCRDYIVFFYFITTMHYVHNYSSIIVFINGHKKLKKLRSKSKKLLISKNRIDPAVKIGILKIIEFVTSIFILLYRDLKCNRIHCQYLHLVLSSFMIPNLFLYGTLYRMYWINKMNS